MLWILCNSGHFVTLEFLAFINFGHLAIIKNFEFGLFWVFGYFSVICNIWNIWRFNFGVIELFVLGNSVFGRFVFALSKICLTHPGGCFKHYLLNLTIICL